MTQPPADRNVPADDPVRRARRKSVFILIGSAWLLFLVTAAVLYYRAVTMNEPNCVIVVDAPAALKGAEIAVDSVMFQRPLKMTVGENDRYSIPFFVDPGDYTVKVTLGGETQFETMLTMTRDGPGRGRLVNLAHLEPTTQPAEPDAERIAPPATMSGTQR